MLKFFTFRLLDAVIASSVAQRKELSYPALRGSVRKDDPLPKGEKWNDQDPCLGHVPEQHVVM